jgi:hypothetical protein
MKWIPLIVFCCLTFVVQANNSTANNFQECGPKGLEAATASSKHFLVNFYANQANRNFLSISDEDRKAIFAQGFKDMNITCTIIKRQFLNFESDTWAMWGVECAEHKSFVFAFQNNSEGTTKLLDCKLCIRQKLNSCLDWCSNNISKNTVNEVPEAPYTTPELTNFQKILTEPSVPLKQMFKDTTNHYTINYPDTWQQWIDSTGMHTFGIPQKPWYVHISSSEPTDFVTKLFQDKPDPSGLKKVLTNIEPIKNIKFLNNGTLKVTATDSSELPAYYITATYQLDGVWFEIWAVVVKRQTAPQYLKFIYVSAIGQEKNTLPIASSMFKSWKIDP